MTRFETEVATESQEQQALFRYCSVEMSRYPDLDMLAHVPNEGKRTKATGARLKREGLRRGYPDIVLDVPRGIYHGLKIELKRRKGSKITQDQKDWIRKLNAQNYLAAFCYGWEEAWELIHAYLTRVDDPRSEALCWKYRNRSLREAAE